MFAKALYVSQPHFYTNIPSNISRILVPSVLLAALPAALSLTLDTPTNVTSGLVSDVTWDSVDGDPTFTLELNHPSFRNSLALANNVNPTSGSPLSIEWPIVPADSGYTLSAVNVTNINAVFSTSGSFSIAQAPTTGVSASHVDFWIRIGHFFDWNIWNIQRRFNGAASFQGGNTAVVVAVFSALAGAAFFL
ncbi:hypothetical protein F5880DRAFT_1503619 [Lentinula raphanica]|nr:hypothetical protein F5880DRAFT_1503619 [Lentinula raphanica]